MRVRQNDNPDITAHCAEEQKVLGLLRDVLGMLATAINSLGGKSSPNFEVRYLFWAAVFVNRSATGYLHLRELGLIDASKLLVRPALEATFYVTAVMTERGFLFRKAYSEWKEENKYARPQNPNDVSAADSALEALKLAFEKDQPGCPILCQKVTVEEAARVAGLQSVYEKAYRVYCQFTHGAMRGVMGDLDDATDPSDTRFIVLSTMKMLELLQAHTEAAVPDLESFKDQLRR